MVRPRANKVIAAASMTPISQGQHDLDLAVAHALEQAGCHAAEEVAEQWPAAGLVHQPFLHLDHGGCLAAGQRTQQQQNADHAHAVMEQRDDGLQRPLLQGARQPRFGEV